METEQFGVRSGGWSDLPISDGTWDEGAARAALDSWAGDSMSQYAKGFLWSGSDPSLKTNYKFPIAKPVDGKLTIFIRAVNNAKARLSQANIPGEDKSRIESVLNGIQRRHGGSEEMALTAAFTPAPVHPSEDWFTKPPIGPKNKTVVTNEGRVYGWAAPPGCHRGAMSQGNVCITPGALGRTFAHFETGSTKTAEGTIINTGSLVWDTTHADTSLKASFAKRHYEDTGVAFADVKVGYDGSQPGGAIWFSGAMKPGTTEADWQKARQHPISIDARRVGPDLALIAALAVNTPGFPVLTASLGDDAEDLGVEIYEEDGVQMTLIASWAPSEEVYEVADVVAVEAAPDPIGTVSPDEGCGCPDVKAEVTGLAPLPTLAELAERRSSLSQFERI